MICSDGKPCGKPCSILDWFEEERKKYGVDMPVEKCPFRKGEKDEKKDNLPLL